MREKQKLINYIAGMTTLIVALLIVIVVFEPREITVSKAAASKTVALALASKEEIMAEAPENSYFPAELQNEWYAKYMDYLYAKGYLNPETCPAEESNVFSSVTYGELSDWIRSVSGETDKVLSTFLAENESKKAAKVVGRAEFWEFFDAFLSVADPEGNVTSLETDLYGTPDNVETAAAWTAYTKDGKYMFEGLSSLY